LSSSINSSEIPNSSNKILDIFAEIKLMSFSNKEDV